MKLSNLLSKIILISMLILLTNMNPGCKDPNEYKPPEDSLLPPPGPPQLFFPPVDTEYVLVPNPGVIHIPFDWSDVEGAEYYEIELSPDSNFINGITHESNSSKLTISFYAPQDLYWHVRAESDSWTWYTPWSESWYFRIRPPLE